MIESLAGKRILFVVAHPDDEALGCGATLHRLVADMGCVIRVVILGEGITSRSRERSKEAWEKELQTHRHNIDTARKNLGYGSTGVYDFPDNRFDTVALLDIVKVIEEEKNSFLPDAIFTHHGGDVNIDHQRTFEAVITATRPLANEKVKAIITFETHSSTEWRASTDPRHFIPNWYVAISQANLEAKVNAMECYEFEKRSFPHPRSPEALRTVAQRWGIAAGEGLAEAFHIVRWISK